MNFLFFFYQSTALSSHTVDGHQMYFGGSVVGKASTIGIEISPTPPLIFSGGQKVRRSMIKGQGHRVKGQGHSVKWCISSKNAIIRQWIGSATSNLAWYR